jgi:hypothetical protein
MVKVMAAAAVSISAALRVNGGANELTTKTITVTVTDLDDEAPTDIQINDTVFINGKVVLTNDKGANFLLGTISVVVMARLGSTVMVNSLEALLPAGSLTH